MADLAPPPDRLMEKTAAAVDAMADELGVSTRRIHQALTPERVALLHRVDQVLDEQVIAAST
jgi:hypothetical protein